MPVDFVVIGAMKCATSTVCAYLEDHPDVFMAAGEPNYFSDDLNFSKGPSWYKEHFVDRVDEKICGEGSNNYSAHAMYPNSAERMAEYDPNLKLIYMARHPLKRIVSAWLQNRTDSGDAVPPNLNEAVRQMPDRFIGQSMYWHNLQAFRKFYPDAQIFIGFMEDLNADAEVFVARLCQFLGIDVVSIQRGHQNKSSGKRVPTQAYTTINRIPLVGVLKKVLPAGLKDTVKSRILSRQIDAPPAFSPAVRSDLVAEIRPDAKAFLEHCGKSADYWSFDSETGERRR